MSGILGRRCSCSGEACRNRAHHAGLGSRDGLKVLARESQQRAVPAGADRCGPWRAGKQGELAEYGAMGELVDKLPILDNLQAAGQQQVSAVRLRTRPEQPVCRWQLDCLCLACEPLQDVVINVGEQGKVSQAFGLTLRERTSGGGRRGGHLRSAATVRP